MESLHQSCEIPVEYGSFHLAWLISFLVLSVICSIIFRKAKDKYLRIFLGILWVIMVVFECLKLTINFTIITDGQTSFEFSPSSLSFQFCSLPLYFLPVVIFKKDGKIRDIFAIFLGTYGLIAGLCVYFFPSTVFSELLFINYQTMIHHGIQLLTGFVLLVRYFDKVNLKIIGKTFLLFFLTVMGARLINELFHSYFPTDETVDFFYISPYTEREFPLIKNFKQLVPNCVFTMGYIAGFTFLASIFYGVPAFIYKKWFCFKHKNNENREQN